MFGGTIAPSGRGTDAEIHRHPCPRPIAAPPLAGGRFMTSKPDRSKGKNHLENMCKFSSLQNEFPARQNGELIRDDRETIPPYQAGTGNLLQKEGDGHVTGDAHSGGGHLFWRGTALARWPPLVQRLSCARGEI